MYRNIDDVKNDMRKLTGSKPVHAVAGAGVLASRTLKDLPWRLVRWTRDNPPNSLPGRANGYVQTAQARANGYVQTARSRASDGYDKLAEHGKKALNGQSDSTPATSTQTTQAKGGLNGKAKGRATPRTGTSS